MADFAPSSADAQQRRSTLPPTVAFADDAPQPDRDFTLSLGTWNLAGGAGVGRGSHRAELLGALARLDADILLLQHTGLTGEADCAAAERAWRRWGPSVWTAGRASGPPERRRAATAVLFRWRNANWHIERAEEGRGGTADVYLALHPRDLRGYGSGKQTVEPHYGRTAEQREKPSGARQPRGGAVAAGGGGGCG